MITLIPFLHCQYNVGGIGTIKMLQNSEFLVESKTQIKFDEFDWLIWLRHTSIITTISWILSSSLSIFIGFFKSFHHLVSTKLNHPEKPHFSLHIYEHEYKSFAPQFDNHLAKFDVVIS